VDAGARLECSVLSSVLRLKHVLLLTHASTQPLLQLVVRGSCCGVAHCRCRQLRLRGCSWQACHRPSPTLLQQHSTRQSVPLLLHCMIACMLCHVCGCVPPGSVDASTGVCMARCGCAHMHPGCRTAAAVVSVPAMLCASAQAWPVCCGLHEVPVLSAVALRPCLACGTCGPCCVVDLCVNHPPPVCVMVLCRPTVGACCVVDVGCVGFSSPVC
jgi:hypothetical protein